MRLHPKLLGKLIRAAVTSFRASETHHTWHVAHLLNYDDWGVLTGRAGRAGGSESSGEKGPRGSMSCRNTAVLSYCMDRDCDPPACLSPPTAPPRRLQDEVFSVRFVIHARRRTDVFQPTRPSTRRRLRPTNFPSCACCGTVVGGTWW